MEECIPPSRLQKRTNFDLVVLLKKYLVGCQILSSKKCLETI